MTTQSLSYVIRNFSPYKVWIVDGWGTMTELPPLVGFGGVDPEIPPVYVGRIVCERFILTIDMDALGNQSDHWAPAGITYLGTPPHLEARMPGFKVEVYELNMIIFGSNAEAINYARLGGKNLFSEFVKTNMGTIFQNAFHFGVMNVTGRTIYMVDDLGADIMVIPSGPDQSMYRYDNSGAEVPPNYGQKYLKLFRYTVQPTPTDTRIKNKEMVINYAQNIVQWGEFPENGEQFLYVPSIGACLFDSIQQAEDFIGEYGTVDSYHRMKLEEEFQDAITTAVDAAAVEFRKRNRRTVWVCMTIVGLQLSGIVGKFLFDQWTTPKPTLPEPPPMDDRKKKTSTSPRSTKPRKALAKGLANLTAALSGRSR